MIPPTEEIWTIRYIALILMISAPTLHAEQLMPDKVVEVLDRAIQQGFPATVDIPLEAASSRVKREDSRDLTGHLTVNGSVPSTVRLPGGVVVQTYEGSLDGDRVVITRSETHMDISRPQAGGMHVTGFTQGSRQVEKIVIPDAGSDGAGIPFVPERIRRADDLAEGIVERKVRLHVFIHDDTRQYMTPKHIHAGYVAWWLTELDRNTLPFVTMELNYHTTMDAMTNIPYMHAKALKDWTNMAYRWAEDEDIDTDDTHLNKFLLITLIDPMPDVTGIAWQGGNAAIAAISGRYRVVAHELGHLFGATHEKAEIRFRNGWWCESNMYPTATLLRTNCYGYSSENRRRMRAYVIEGPSPPSGMGRGPEVIN